MSDRPGRRRFLACVSAASAAAAVSNSGCSSEPSTGLDPNAVPFDAGTVSDFAVSVVKVMYSHRAIVGRDADGFYAMSVVCTHAACDISAPNRGVCIPAGNSDLVIPITVAPDVAVMCCACHNSTYDSLGRVKSGPAPRPLTHFKVTVIDGVVHVDPRVGAAVTDRAVPMRSDGGTADASTLD